MTIIAHIAGLHILPSDGADTVRFRIKYYVSDGAFSSGMDEVLAIDTEANMLSALHTAIANDVNAKLSTSFTGADVRLF